MTPDTPNLFAGLEHAGGDAGARAKYPRRRRFRALYVIRRGRERPARHLRLLLKHLDRNWFDPEVAASPLERPEFAGELRALGVPVHTLDMHRTLTVGEDMKAIHRLTTLLRSGRFDVVHLHGCKAGFLGRPAARAANVRAVIYTPHELRFEYAHRVRTRNFHRRVERTLGRFTDAMICASRTEAEEARRLRLLPPGRIHTIGDGVDFDELPQHVNHIDVRVRLGINIATQLVVMTGRLDPPMDPGTLLRAARHVLRVQPRTRFVIAGEGELLDFSRGLAGQLGINGQVMCTGHRADATEIASVAQINVFSASHGAPPLHLLESMGLGRPFIASDIPGCREVITHGRTGVLFPAGDERILAGAILKVIGDRPISRRLGKGAREYIETTHSAGSWARAIEEVYLKTLAESV